MKSKKLLFVILFIFILTLILNLGVYATNVPKPSEPYTYPYWIIYERDSGLRMWESRYPIKVYSSSGQLNKFRTAGPAFLWKVDTWFIANSRTLDEGGTTYYPSAASDDCILLYANHDIINDFNGTVFFSKTLPVSQKDMKEVLKENPPLSLMSPLIRGIIPYLIGLVIASVGFWKAWQFLSKTLQKA